MTELYNQSDDQIRAAFERWADRYGYNVDRDKDVPLPLYASLRTQAAWRGWVGAMDTIRRQANEH